MHGRFGILSPFIRVGTRRHGSGEETELKEHFGVDPVITGNEQSPMSTIGSKL